MALVPVYYEVPEHIARGLASGDLTRFGSVVRNSSRIIRHLQEVQPPSEDAARSAKAGVAAIRKPAVLVATAATTVVVAGGTFVYSQQRKVEELIDALAGYFESVHIGSLDLASIEHVSTAAADLPRLIVRRDKLAPLIEQVGHITQQLAEANSVSLSSEEELATRGDNISDLRANLNAQRRIFRNAA